MKDKQDNEIHSQVKKHYGEVAKASSDYCLPIETSLPVASNACCAPNTSHDAHAYSKSIGYSEAELNSVPEGANLGLGCGNPSALASLQAGETVLDLGSGAGFDAFLARQQVGESGQVIGVDMTDDMLNKARKNAEKANYRNVEFRKGKIEQLPIENNSIDCAISNCVINLSPDKLAVFREAFRVLKTGGRLMISDIVLIKDLSKEMQQSVAAYVGCIAGAIHKDEYIQAMKNAGFAQIEVLEATNPTESFEIFCGCVTKEVAQETLKAIQNVKITAHKK